MQYVNTMLCLIIAMCCCTTINLNRLLLFLLLRHKLEYKIFKPLSPANLLTRMDAGEERKGRNKVEVSHVDHCCSSMGCQRFYHVSRSVCMGAAFIDRA